MNKVSSMQEKEKEKIIKRIERLDVDSSQRASILMEKFDEMEELIQEGQKLKDEGEEARKNAIKEDIEEFREDFEENSLFLLETSNETRRDLEKTSNELDVKEEIIVRVIFNKAMSSLKSSKEDIVETLTYKGKLDEETAKDYISKEKVDVLSEASS